MSPSYLISHEATDCYGCRSCEQKCPNLSITIKENEEGFIYPEVDNNTCTHCDLCLKSCPATYNLSTSNNYPIIKAARSKDESDLRISSSGALFSVFLKYVLPDKGAISGCIFDSKFKAFHIVSQNEAQISKMHGSKYLQSDTRFVFSEIEDFLKKDTMVLFTGTPCQVDGLKKFLGKEYENLICIDLVCHGVPSQRLFDNYLKELESKHKMKISDYQFRSKEVRGWSQDGQYTFEKHGKRIIKELLPECDYYYSLFSQSLANRESCYVCPYASIDRVGDFTIADFWGILNVNPKFYSKKGISLLMINNEKAEKIFTRIKDNIECISVTRDQALHNLSNFRGPYKRPICRDTIYKDISTIGFCVTASKYCKLHPFRARLRRLISEERRFKIRRVIMKVRNK